MQRPLLLPWLCVGLLFQRLCSDPLQKKKKKKKKHSNKQRNDKEELQKQRLTKKGVERKSTIAHHFSFSTRENCAVQKSGPHTEDQ